MKKTFLLILISSLVLVSFFVYKKGRDLLFPLKYRSLVFQMAEKYKLDPLLVAAVISAESSFNSKAISGTGARGLMQIMPTTGVDIARKLRYKDFKLDDLYKPIINIEFGCFYFQQLYKRYDDITLALIAYNAGITNLNRWLKEVSSKDQLISSGLVFQETLNYVNRVHKILHVIQILDKIQNFGDLNGFADGTETNNT